MGRVSGPVKVQQRMEYEVHWHVGVYFQVSNFVSRGGWVCVCLRWLNSIVLRFPGFSDSMEDAPLFFSPSFAAYCVSC